MSPLIVIIGTPLSTRAENEGFFFPLELSFESFKSSINCSSVFPKERLIRSIIQGGGWE